YLNPCRPQRGTWKFDRAGWAPGDLVLPWAVDVSHLLSGESSLTVGYTLDDYLNEGRGQTWAPHHWTHGYIVFFE
ncbi:MAG: peptide-N-glycosidase F-related protein, partial [Planctomycetota bacterium]